MKLLHTADIHIGKIVNEISMLEDQQYMLEQMLQIIEEEAVDGVIIAGDIYDRSIPPAEAVTMLDWFLTTLVEHNVKVYMISGNHDSAERIGFASGILDGKGVYVGDTRHGRARRIPCEKDGVKVDIYLLPFMKPQTVQYYEPKETAAEQRLVTFEEGVRASLSHITVDPSVVNILVTHHFVTSNGVDPEVSDSETSLSLGGIDKVDTSVFDAFDYVALGHIHRPQRIGRDTIRYAGSPLKYSFSEVFQKKSVTILNIDEEKQIQCSTRELVPKRDMRKIKGTLSDLMNPEYYKLADTNDYIQATLTDTVELVDPIGQLRSIYPNIMQLILEKNQSSQLQMEADYVARKQKSALELFEEFYHSVRNQELDEERKAIMQQVIEQASEEVGR